MFHTFEAPRNRGEGTRRESVGRRVTTLRACTSCRQRKVKCDGQKPCEACRWYNKIDECHYTDVRPSRRQLEKMSTTLDEYRSVLKKLFPEFSPDSLVDLSREDLLELITGTQPPPQANVQHPMSPATSAEVEGCVSPFSNAEENLESLQGMPEEVSESSRNSSSADLVEGVSDDVNALSLASRQPSSYLGVSSIQAILKVIVWLDPGCVPHLARTSGLNHDNTASNVSAGWQHRLSGKVSQSCIPPTEMQMLDAYFLHFHAFAPLIDELSFRETYMVSRRRDDHWFALLNIVLALGSVAATRPEDQTHQMYFLRFKNHLSLTSLGSVHLETIQALGLFGGWYCHYISQPNLSYSLIGTALRMATALGMHKEFGDSSKPPSPAKIASMDLRSRIWWSLVCMDTWAGMTLGRPSMGRFSPSITVKPPHFRDKENVLGILPLVENIRFAKIATKVQESLAGAPLVKHQEMSHADHQLMEWWETLPTVLKDNKPCPESIKTVRTVMRWRYYNQRMLLYRPTLLSYAMRRIPYIDLELEERIAIQKCRDVAELSIQDIAATAELNQLCAWNAVWWTFQATLVPLLGLFLNDWAVDDPRASITSCQAQVETAMMTLARMSAYGHTAARSLDAISRIFEASKRKAHLAAQEILPQGMFCDPHPIGRDVPAAFSQHDVTRGGLFFGNNDMADALSIPAVDASGGQLLWEYLSWSENDLWSGLVTNFDAPSKAMAA